MPIRPFTSATCVLNERGTNFVINIRMLASHPPQVVTSVPFKSKWDHIMCGIQLTLMRSQAPW
jgi:hypothetical protein